MEEQQAQETKKCPYCAETILAEAVRCRYCQANLAEAKSPEDDSKPVPKPKPRGFTDEEALAIAGGSHRTMRRNAIGSLVIGGLGILLAILADAGEPVKILWFLSIMLVGVGIAGLMIQKIEMVLVEAIVFGIFGVVNLATGSPFSGILGLVLSAFYFVTYFRAINVRRIR